MVGEKAARTLWKEKSPSALGGELAIQKQSLPDDKSSKRSVHHEMKRKHEEESVTVVQGEICKENLEWLSKSIVAKSRNRSTFITFYNGCQGF